MNLEWYKEFFDGIAMDFWRLAADPERTVAEAGFLERELALRPGARVLDVPCGFGRHALELARRGYSMTGVDLSRYGIEDARRRALALGLGATITWRHGDMRDLPWSGAFDAAYCFGNSFGYLEPAGTRAFLEAVAGALRPGARFALQTGAAAECILPRFVAHERAEVGDITFIEDNRYHADRSCIETEYTFVRDGEETKRVGVQWIYTAREIESILRFAGLEVRRTYGNAGDEPFTLGAHLLVIVAEKPSS